MKDPITRQSPRSQSLRALALSFTFATGLAAAPVDSEILILVDGQTFSNASFDLILDGVAQAFEQQSFIESVAGGVHGSIAASVIVFGSEGASTAVSWMDLSSAEDLQGFANSVRNIVAPPSFGAISYVDAIASGAASIAANTAEGTLRQLTIIEDGGFFLFSDTGAEVQAARDAALAGGVDVINSVVFNAAGRETAIQNYYEANVVSGGPGGEVDVIGGSTFGAPGGALGDSIQENIGQNLVQPTVDANNLSAVPEPSVSFLGALTALSLLVRRRRG